MWLPVTSENFTIGTDGYLLHRFDPNGYAQIGDATFRYNATVKDWQVSHSSIQISDAPLAATFNFKADRSLSKGLAHDDAPDHKTYDLLAELNALVDDTEVNNLADVLRD